tara:strand:- start:5 stop:1015 length:1011 start_codon:yes stop_codon:yes gene_type:complete
MATGYRNEWSFKSLGKEDKERNSAPVGAAPATTGVVAFVQSLGLTNLQLIGIAAVSVLVVVGTSVGIAGAAGAFDSGPAPPSPPACIDDGADSCQWVNRGLAADGDGGPGWFEHEYLYSEIDNTSTVQCNTTCPEFNLHGNGKCDESDGESYWTVSSTRPNLRTIVEVPFVCDAKTDVTDCCNFRTDFYNTSSSRRRLERLERRRRLDAYVYNESETLPFEIVLPLTARLANRILNDRSVMHIGLPDAVRELFFIFATSLHNYTGPVSGTANPASSGGCLARGNKTQVPSCVNVTTSTACGDGYVDLVDNKIGAACSWDTSAVTAECARSNWLRYC